MTRPVRSLALPVACAVVLWGAAGAIAQTAGDWSQYQADAAHLGAAAGPEPGYRETWTLAVPPGGPGDRFGSSPPIVTDGLVIAVGPEQVVAVDIATGEQAWTLDKQLGPSVPGAATQVGDQAAFLYTDGWGDGPPDAPNATASTSPSTSPSSGTSPSASPTEDAGEEPPSFLVAVALEDRTELWRAELPAVSRSGVTVIGDVALVGTNDGSVTAVGLADGEVAWSTDIGRAVDVAIAADGDLVVASSRGAVDASSAIVGLSLTDGTERWRFVPSGIAPFTGPPSIAGDAAFVGFADRHVYAIETADGTQRWSATVNGSAPLSPIAVSDDAAFVISIGSFGSQLAAFDTATGAKRWDHPLGVSVYRAPPLLLGGSVVTGALDGDLFAFDAVSGDLVWRGAGVGPVRALAADGTTLVVVRANPAGFQAFVHDPAVPLVAIQSPTTSRPGLVVAWWAAGAVIVGAAALGLGTLLARRVGPPAFPDADEPDEEDA